MPETSNKHSSLNRWIIIISIVRSYQSRVTWHQSPRSGKITTTVNADAGATRPPAIVIREVGRRNCSTCVMWAARLSSLRRREPRTRRDDYGAVCLLLGLVFDVTGSNNFWNVVAGKKRKGGWNDRRENERRSLGWEQIKFYVICNLFSLMSANEMKWTWHKSSKDTKKVYLLHLDKEVKQNECSV